MTNAKRKTKTARTRAPRRKRVRSRTRRGSTSSAVRQLDAAAFAAYGFDRKAIERAPPPALAFHFGLVGHGYELRLFEDGQYMGARCRDFSDSYTVEDLKASLVKVISDAVSTWRTGL